MKKYVIILLALCFDGFSMDDSSKAIKTDDFSEAISTYAKDTEALEARLEELKNSSKEADLFLKKYYEAEQSTSMAFEPATIQRVNEAADYIGRVCYEKGYAESTDTAFLEKAIQFMNKSGNGAGFDNVSEAVMHNSDLLIEDAKHLLEMRTDYNKTSLEVFKKLSESLDKIINNRCN